MGMGASRRSRLYDFESDSAFSISLRANGSHPEVLHLLQEVFDQCYLERSLYASFLSHAGTPFYLSGCG